MSVSLVLALLCSVSANPAGSSEFDYGKIDRVILKEPDYDTKDPKYALLLFGEVAAVRVWVVLDGKTIYIDRNADGDLTDKDERFDKSADCKDIAIADKNGKPRYKITSVSHAPMPIVNNKPAVIEDKR